MSNHNTLISQLFNCYITHGFWKSMNPFRMMPYLMRMAEHYSQGQSRDTEKLKKVKDTMKLLEGKIDNYTPYQIRLFKETA